MMPRINEIWACVVMLVIGAPGLQHDDFAPCCPSGMTASPPVGYGVRQLAGEAAPREINPQGQSRGGIDALGALAHKLVGRVRRPGRWQQDLNLLAGYGSLLLPAFYHDSPSCEGWALTTMALAGFFHPADSPCITFPCCS